MKIRRYLGSNTQEAILKVKMDLGNDALILNTRKVRKKGFLKFFAKPMVEVLAAIDDSAAKKDRGVTQYEVKALGTERENQTGNAAGEKNGKLEQLEKKVASMESMLKKICERMQIPEERLSVSYKEEKQETSAKVLQVFYDNLIKNEVEPEIAKQVIGAASSRIGDNASVNDVASTLYNVISEMLGKPDTIKLKEDKKPTVVMCVGPTGVGKTTTLAKIAASYMLNHKKQVGFITADTYRIAAVEQLKTYAEILGMPVTVIYSPNEMEAAIKNYSDKDIILIDTAGRSYRNKAQLDELKSLVLASGADEVFLALSMTTSPKICKEILNSYSFLEDYKLIFTKTDEALSSGIVLNARFFTGRSLSYMTTGQNVPDDIEIVDIDKITKNLLRSII